MWERLGTRVPDGYEDGHEESAPATQQEAVQGNATRERRMVRRDCSGQRHISARLRRAGP
jgi:hypothetical protein